MKPRIFIGSSGQAAKYAGAIHDALVRVAECTVWTEGAFRLSKSTLDNLMRHLHSSDFGIFVFAADDVANIKGELLDVTRDNVVFEAGLFGGRLSPERCFIVTPLSIKVHMPTDLLGITYSEYEDTRTDKSYVSAVSTFCRKVEGEIERQGLFLGHLDGPVSELAIKFECCEWIPDGKDSDNPSKERVAKKKQVSQEVVTYCHHNEVNKHRLLREQRPGYCLVLLSAIAQRPEEGDAHLLTKIEYKALPPVFIFYKVVEAIEALREAGQLNATKGAALQQWASAIPKMTPELKERIVRATSS